MSSAVYLPPERVRYWRDADNVLSIAKREDETVPLFLDWSDLVDWIMTVSYVDDGVTRTGDTQTTTTTTTYVTGLGSTEVTITASTGEKRQMLVRFVAESGSGQVSDYDE